jgi:hypothetical protein
MGSNSGGWAEGGVLMTYERRRFVLSVEFTYVLIRLDETSRRKLAAPAVC